MTDEIEENGVLEPTYFYLPNTPLNDVRYEPNQCFIHINSFGFCGRSPVGLESRLRVHQQSKSAPLRAKFFMGNVVIKIVFSKGFVKIKY